jgi:hypothetical protein
MRVMEGGCVIASDAIGYGNQLSTIAHVRTRLLRVKAHNGAERMIAVIYH